MKKYLTILMMTLVLVFGCVPINPLPENVKVVQTPSTCVQILVNKIDYELFTQMFDSLNYVLKENIDTVKIHILSPGGDITLMFAVYDLLMEFKAKGLKIETHGYGMVASASVPIFLTGDIRTLNKHGYIMLHPHSGQENEYYQGNINETLKEWTSLYTKIIVRHSKIKYEDALKYLTGNFQLKADYIDAEKSLEYGLITEIR